MRYLLLVLITASLYGQHVEPYYPHLDGDSPRDRAHKYVFE